MIASDSCGSSQDSHEAESRARKAQRRGGDDNRRR
eukprot:CAMPEP_0117678554 /NCGR_PEP_ID=MMETSP0804-20121206/17359_1 /TAXON_ID=1074897 /ORGANISM="Tetraselmis astigmatica, Strain CCMP880" /LENGTH=34 /DNA_ID= /DNA_START= /DNA_END= /DNA_ORIENTATION=